MLHRAPFLLFFVIKFGHQGALRQPPEQPGKQHCAKHQRTMVGLGGSCHVRRYLALVQHYSFRHHSQTSQNHKVAARGTHDADSTQPKNALNCCPFKVT